MAKPSFADLITERRLRELAGARSYDRGEAYFEAGAVERLREDGGRIVARVEGGDTYTAKLWLDKAVLDYDCTCPVGQDGEFCKHLVATGLAWLSGDAPDAGSETDAIRAYLDGADKAVLIDLLLEAAQDDDALANRLLLGAQRQGTATPDHLRKRIAAAFANTDFIDHGRMPSYAASLAFIPGMLAELLRQGDARTTAELAVTAWRGVMRVMQQADDSDGDLGGVMQELVELIVKAANKKALPQLELAELVFELQMADDFGFLTLEPFRYALGKVGLAAYRGSVAAAWARVPALKPGDGKDGHYDTARFHVTAMMLALERLQGDIDAVVAVMRRDLSHPHDYLRIAETLTQAGRHDEALRWAEDGRRAFPAKDARFDDFLVAAYQRARRHDDAMALRWAAFEKHPSLRGFQDLHAAATKARAWPAWRARAHEQLRAAAAAEGTPNKATRYRVSDSSAVALVEVLLWEGDALAALAAARSAPCDTPLWLELAGALETDSPADAVAIYQSQIDPIVGATNHNAYDHAATIIDRVLELMTREGAGGQFPAWLETVRGRHRAKRNLMKRIAEFDVVQASRRGKG